MCSKRLNVSNCLIAEESRSPPLPLPREARGTAPKEMLTCSYPGAASVTGVNLGGINSFYSPFLRHRAVLIHSLQALVSPLQFPGACRQGDVSLQESSMGLVGVSAEQWAEMKSQQQHYLPSG